MDTNCSQARWVDAAGAAVSKEDRLEMHSTHHNPLKVSSYIYAQKKKKEKKGGRLLSFYDSGIEMKANKLRIQKKWLGGCSQYSNLAVGHKPDWTGLGSMNVQFSTGSSFPLLRNLILIINPSTETGGRTWSTVFQSNLAVPTPYCTTGHSDPLKVTMVT